MIAQICIASYSYDPLLSIGQNHFDKLNKNFGRVSLSTLHIPK